MSNPPLCTFVSYSRRDSAFALRLVKDLRDLGAKVWFDQLDIPKGRPWDDAIEAALKSSTGFLIILSPDSAESHNVKDEIALALNTGKRIFPVLHRPCDIPLRLQRLQYIDFAQGYETGLQSLREAMVAEGDAVSSNSSLIRSGRKRRQVTMLLVLCGMTIFLGGLYLYYFTPSFRSIASGNLEPSHPKPISKPSTKSTSDTTANADGTAPLIEGLATSVIWNPSVNPEKEEVSGDIHLSALPHPIQIALGRDHPNGVRFEIFYGKSAVNLYRDLPKVNGIDSFGELDPSLYLQAGSYDFGNTGNPQLVLALGDGLTRLEAFVFQFAGGLDPTARKAWKQAGTISGQSKLIIENNKVIAPYGSFGLFEEYVWSGRSLTHNSNH